MKKHEKVFKFIIRRKGCAESILTTPDDFFGRERLQYFTKKYTEKAPDEDRRSIKNLGIFCFKDLESARNFKETVLIHIMNREELKSLELFQALALNPREVSNYIEKHFPKGTMLTEKLKLVKRYL